MICHLLSELVLFSSKLSYTKSAKYKQREAITRIPPGNCPQSKVSKVSSSFNPAVAIFCWWLGDQPTVYVWTWQVSKAEAPKRKTAGFSGSGGCKRGGKMFFFTFWFIWYCFISLFFYPLTDLLELVLPKDKVVNMY